MGCGAHEHCMVSEEVERNLMAIAEVLSADHDGVLKAWAELYGRDFGPRGALSTSEFSAVYGPHLTATWPVLMRGELTALAAVQLELARALLAKQVSFAEASGVLHLFPEAVTSVLQVRLARELRSAAFYAALNRLTHCRVAMLAQGYYERDESAPISIPTTVPGLVGVSAAMRQLRRELLARAKAAGPILLTGESGAGRETVARALHELRAHGGERWVVVSCVGASPEALDLELFGPASVVGGGLVHQMGRGSLLLVELTALPLWIQAKLLRELESCDGRSDHLRCQIMFSTTQDPLVALKDQRLLPELWYRLAPGRIHVPPLRARREDLEVLVLHFLDRLAGRGSRQVRGIEPEALALLGMQEWPGNLRQLHAVVEQAALAARGNTLTAADLAIALGRSLPAPEVASESVKLAPKASLSIEEAERATIQRALSEAGGNKVQAARMLGISRHRLYDRIRRWELVAR
ncbi:MAG: sigma-54-dependent Fis family transcriptional regulator [Deltaproteobacteria bacterium]|jgi:DNA-binding NtrC family response regulator|nr:sigma-54-dependent Fis family transcriptional regulator [Deltaproteobacteria bacterium]